MTQIPLWLGDEPTDDRPLPERIADGGQDWESFPLQYQDVDGTRFYAIQDWLRGVALTIDASGFWAKLKKRLEKAGIETRTWCPSLPYRAKDGKRYKRAFATAEGLYRITQRMDAETGIRNKVLAYLAKAGVLVDEQRIESLRTQAITPPQNERERRYVYRQIVEHGMDRTAALEQLENRRDTKRTFRTLTSAIEAFVEKPIFGQIIDGEYQGLYGMKTKHCANICAPKISAMPSRRSI